MAKKLYCGVCDRVITDEPHAHVNLMIKQFLKGESRGTTSCSAPLCYRCLLEWVVVTAIPLQIRLRKEQRNWEEQERAASGERESTPPAESADCEPTASNVETSDQTGNS